ncbi:MAG: T9SS C-terminal target domain-containing protein, partial [Flavobacteriales bacterium]
MRARIENGGNLWQNRETHTPAYEVPKVDGYTGPNSLYAGALWIGGRTPDNQLKLAAVTFRDKGNDFWPGPLTTIDTINHTGGDASIDGTVCTQYDKTYKTERKDAALQDAYFRCLMDPTCDAAVEFPGYAVPAYFNSWPANGDVSLGQDRHLAPFTPGPGRTTEEDYDPSQGDYPGYDLSGTIDCKLKRREDLVPLFGDQNIWWIFNDKGNTHTESGGTAIGMEIRAQAFAFSTNDEVNNMTFYNYELINQSSQALTQTYFGQFVDPDLGGGFDDEVGCDVQRGLGYCYNGDAVDEDYNGEPGYGGPNPPPPAVGVDFFEGPYQDYDGIDNPLTTNCDSARTLLGIPYKGIGIGYGDDVPDNERYGMRAFVYFKNVLSGQQHDPSNAIQYYNYLKSIWLDNTLMTYGGSGYSTSASALPALYMFPGISDPVGWGTACNPQPNWDEVTAGNAPGDRRFIQSAGPFTLQPGAYNNVTVGVVWARSPNGNVQSSVDLMRKADDKAQSLFDNCFRILNGPDAPNVGIQELDHQLILTISNPQGSNNFNEQYVELDPSIPESDTIGGVPYTDLQRSYLFEGYQIYQVANAAVSPDQLQDPDKARLVAQVDLKDGVTQLINWIQDPELGLAVPKEMVYGGDSGIVHSFNITKNLFATSDPTLTNFQTYYFVAIAYGYNKYKLFSQNANGATGQPFPYKSSRKSPTGAIRVYAGIP